MLKKLCSYHSALYLVIIQKMIAIYIIIIFLICLLCISSGSRLKSINQSINQSKFPSGLAVKDLVLSLLWLRFDPWPGYFCMLQAQQKKKKKKKKIKENKIAYFMGLSWGLNNMCEDALSTTCQHCVLFLKIIINKDLSICKTLTPQLQYK